MSRLLQVKFAILVAVLSLLGPVRGWAGAPRQPNILLLVTDDQRWDALGCMGNPVIKTPHLDGLAKKGILFRNCFCTTSICATSRASILTGQYASRHQILDFRTALPRSAFNQSFPRVLKRNGYRTAFIGKWGLGGELPERMYDYWEGFSGQGAYYPSNTKTDKQQLLKARQAGEQTPAHLTAKLGRSAIKFLDTCTSEEPFCLQLNFKAAHCQDGGRWQFQHDLRYADLYEGQTIPSLPTANQAHFQKLPDFLQNSEARRRWKLRFATPQMYQESVKDYYRLLTGVDDAVGKIVAKLREKKLADNTVIMFTSDNGFYLGDYGLAGKWFMHEPSIRLPLIIFDPRLPKSRRGAKVDQMALTIDLAPTIMDLAGAKVPARIQGRSLMPAVHGKSAPVWRTAFVYEHPFKHKTIPPSVGLRTNRYKYVRYPDQDKEQLFDLYRDPLEQTDLAARPGRKKQVDQIRQRFERMYRFVAGKGNPKSKPEKPASLTYPATRKSDHTDNYHGTIVPDPYRWLEDPDSKATKAWVKSQNEVTFGYLKAIPQRQPFVDRLTKLWNYERYGLPSKRGTRYFYTYNNGLQNQSVLYVAESLAAKPRVLLDPNKLSKDGTVALAGWAVSEDGNLLAYGLASAGSDWREWKVLEVDTGKTRSDHLKWVKFSGVSWTPDNKGFYYSRYDEPKEGTKFTGSNYFHKLYFHRIGDDQSKDKLVYERKDQKEWGFDGHVSEDGKYLIISVWKGTLPKNQLFYQDLMDPRAKVVELLKGFDAEYEFVGNDGTTLWLATDLDAPKRRLIAIDTKKPQRSHWKELIPEAENVLESVNLVGNHFLASYLKDAQSRIRVFGLDGKHQRDVDLPSIGSADGFRGRRKSKETFYSFSNFTTPSSIYRYDLEAGKSEIFRRPQVDFDPSDYVTRQVFFNSTDGTKLPMFITHRKGLKLTGKNPTLLYAYGGFNISITPSFSVANLVWLESGGIYAVPNLRGGGEYGRDWHEAGMLNKKQNVFDDFISAGEWLIKNKYTDRSKLAIRGGSNGGLLVGACMTQRPDLYAVALPAVGVMDMLRYHKFTIGWAWVSEYGSAENAKQFAHLYQYSPVHNLVPGTRYPATMVTTADHDDRVVPAHSFKYAATLQHAHKGNPPVLIRIETSAGHGAGTPTSKRIEAAADMLAFLFQNLNMKSANE